jgi:hypothetical protein
MNIRELAYLLVRTDAAMIRQGVSQAARTEVLDVISSTSVIDFEPVATPGAKVTGEDSEHLRPESSRPRELLAESRHQHRFDGVNADGMYECRCGLV